MIDTHFHLMQTEPSGDGSDVDDYLREMDRFDMDLAFLVQPSSHGFDTCATLGFLERFPERFKGVVAVPLTVDQEELATLKSKGVIGARMNMVHNPDQLELPGADFLKRLRDLGLFLQVFAGGERLARVVERAVETETPLVVDHMGRPTPSMGFDQTGYREMLDGAREGKVIVKLSAPFRIAEEDNGYAAASRFAREALSRVPIAQFVVGTDWPFINCDCEPRMGKVIAWLRSLFPDASDWERVAVGNPIDLLGSLG